MNKKDEVTDRLQNCILDRYHVEYPQEDEADDTDRTSCFTIS